MFATTKISQKYIFLMCHIKKEENLTFRKQVKQLTHIQRTDSGDGDG